MSPLNTEQLEQIRNKRKEQIMNAALKVFARRGFIGAKTSMIAKEAGLSEGLLYNYFNSKDELFVSLVQIAVEASTKTFEAVHQFPGSPLEQLRKLSTHILDDEYQDVFLLIHQTRIGDGIPDPAKLLLKQHSAKSYAEKLVPLFEKGQKLSEFLKGNPSELASNYLKVLSGLMTLKLSEDDESLPEVDWLLRLVINPAVLTQDRNETD
jgi:AcrR family transcriptional regulator